MRQAGPEDRSFMSKKSCLQWLPFVRRIEGKCACPIPRCGRCHIAGTAYPSSR